MLRFNKSRSPPLWVTYISTCAMKTWELFFKPPLRNPKSVWNMSERAFSAACVIDACLRLAHKRFAFCSAISRIAAWSFREWRIKCVVTSFADFGNGRSPLVSNACSNVSTGFYSRLSIPGIWHTDRSDGLVVFCRKRLGSVAISVKFGVLPVYPLVQ